MSETNNLRTFYFGIDWSKRYPIRKRITAVMGWNEKKFYRIIGGQKITKAETEKINEFINN